MAGATSRLTIFGLTLLLVGCSAGATSSATTSSFRADAAGGLHLQSIAAPVGFDVPGARWIEIDDPDGRSQLAAVFAPDGPGPFPLVVFLHGVSGLTRSQLQWAPRLAAAGYLVVAGCYLAANVTSVVPDPSTLVPCTGLGAHDPSNARAVATAYTALVNGAKALTAAKQGTFGLVGVSFGAEVALDVVDPSLAAVVADSGYGSGPTSAGDAPVLILGGAADPMVAHADLVAYEQALRAAGKNVESHYYDGAGHIVTMFPTTSADATQRVITFLVEHLR
jgi:dienelactone hydrolase